MTNLTPGEIKNAPTIVLAGRVFHIPKLTSKENRVVVGALSSLLPLLSKLEQSLSVATDKSSAAIALVANFPLDEQTYDTCLRAIYAAVTRGDPNISRDEFDAMEIGIDEVLVALPTVMMQSFAFKKKEEAGPKAAPGELPATPSTGTGSLSESAAPPAGPGTMSSAA